MRRSIKLLGIVASLASFAFLAPFTLGACGDGAHPTDGDAPADSEATDVIGDSIVTADVLADGAPVDSGDSASPCGIIACDDAKKFYPKIRAAFDAHGGDTAVGTPRDNGGGIYVHVWGAGRVQDFDGGSLGPSTIASADAAATWADKAYVVRGSIRGTWIALGGAPSIGYPIEDEHAGPGGQVQTFEKGCIGPDGAGGYQLVDKCVAPPDLTTVLTSLESKAAKSTAGTDFGIAVEWLPTGTKWGARADIPRNSASSAKFIWATAALFEKDIAAVETPALPTFKDSNNSTAGQLIDLAGGVDAVNDFMVTQLGIPQTDVSLCHWSYDKTRTATTCSDRLGGENFFTPNGALTFLEKLWKSAPVPADKRAKLLEWSTLSPRSGYGGWISTQLPASVHPAVHHKAGWLPMGCCGAGFPAHYNEVALVPTPRGEYAVVLSMRGGASDAAMTGTLEYSSCVIWHALAADVADPFGACKAP